MTTDDTNITQSSGSFRLPDPPRRQPDEATQFDQLFKTGNAYHLALHFGHSETTLVEANRWMVASPSTDLADARQPDLLIAFDVKPAAYEANNGYVVSEQGKPPDFVIEIASESTASIDVGEKRDDYADLGILEYWRFDKTGEFYGTRLAADRLVDGVYQPIQIDELDDHVLQGHSTVLNLILRWEQGTLAWHDPATGEHIPTFESVRSKRLAAEAEFRAIRLARIAAEERADTERTARLTAEDRADNEREARLAAEERATAAEARIRELEARVYNTDL